MIDWDDYRLLLAISRGRGLPKAAKSLAVTISTVYRRLEKIEQKLGGSIFIKNRTGYQPNDAGIILIEHAIRIENEVLSAERHIKGQDAELIGKVSLTGSEVLAPFFIARHISAFTKRYSGLSLDILAGNSTLDLAAHQADIAFRPTRPTEESLFGRKLTDIRWGVYGRSRPKNKFIEFNDMQTIATQPFIGLNGNNIAELAMLEQLARFPKANIEISTNSLISMAKIASESDYLAFLPCLLGEQWPKLMCFSTPLEHDFGELWIVCHQDLRRNAKVRSVFDFFILAAQEDSALFLNEEH